MTRSFFIAGSAAIFAFTSITAVAQTSAQAFPSKLVKFVVPFPPGGGVDVLTRAVAAELGKKWGQPVIVENKPGAGAIVGADFVAKSPADGHTLLATVNQTVTTNRFLFKSLPYDPDKSLMPIMEMVESEQLILANAQVPANNLRDLVALAKKEPGKLSYGSWGQGTQPHLMFSLLSKKENLDMTHVPYKGVAQIMTSLAGGEIPISSGSGSVAGELLKAGRLKPLAITSKQRSPIFPNVPTAQEQGYGYLTASIWYGLFAPAGTPTALIEKINADVRAVLRDPQFSEKNVTSRNLNVVASTPQQFQAEINDEVKQVREMIRAADVKPE